MTTPLKVTSLAALAAGSLLLSACSSSDAGSSDAGSGTPTPTSTANPDPSVAAKIMPPVLVTPGETTAKATVGETVVFNVVDPVGTAVSVDKPEVLEVKPGYSDGSATFNPGGVAKQPGTAVVTLTPKGGSASTITVTVTAS